MNSILFCSIAVARSITNHNNLIQIIPEFQHFLDTGSLGSNILSQNNISMFEKSKLAPLFFNGIPVGRRNHSYIRELMGRRQTISSAFIRNFQAFIKGSLVLQDLWEGRRASVEDQWRAAARAP